MSGKLSEISKGGGVVSRDGIDNLDLNSTQMFHNIAFLFGDEEIVIKYQKMYTTSRI